MISIRSLDKLSTVEEKEAAGLEVNILARVELITRQQSHTVPEQQDHFEGMTLWAYEKLEEVVSRMLKDSSFKEQIIQQYKMYPTYNQREQGGFIKGAAVQRFLASTTRERERIRSSDKVQAVMKQRIR